MIRKLEIWLGGIILVFLFSGCWRDNTGHVMIGDETFFIHLPNANSAFIRPWEAQNDTLYRLDLCNAGKNGPCDSLAVAFKDRDSGSGAPYQNQILFNIVTGEIVGVRVYYIDSMEQEISQLISYSENIVEKKDSNIFFVRGYKMYSYYVNGELGQYEPCFCNIFLPKDVPFYGAP